MLPARAQSDGFFGVFREETYGIPTGSPMRAVMMARGRGGFGGRGRGRGGAGAWGRGGRVAVVVRRGKTIRAAFAARPRVTDTFKSELERMETLKVGALTRSHALVKSHRTHGADGPNLPRTQTELANGAADAADVFLLRHAYGTHRLLSEQCLVSRTRACCGALARCNACVREGPGKAVQCQRREQRPRHRLPHEEPRAPLSAAHLVLHGACARHHPAAPSFDDPTARRVRR
jgi:hypothetical protein